MSGHSKWATIKRKKGAADAKRGQVFTKYANAIAVAARDGGDPETNYKLRLAIDKAKSLNMPTANIQRAVDRGSGKSQEKRPEDVTYEGYGPGGVALMVSCATDNTNRTLAEVKSAITKQGGRLAEPGAVAYQFRQKGVIVVTGDQLEEASLVAIDGGAEDIESGSDLLTIYTPPKKLMAVKLALEDAGHNIDSAELSFEPTQSLTVSDKNVAAKILKLVENLEELDDVVAVYSNFDIPEDLLEELV